MTHNGKSNSQGIEAQWEDLQHQARRGMPDVDFLVRADELLSQLDADDPLAYRIRMFAVENRTELDPVAALDEFEALLNIHESDPERYPKNLLDDTNSNCFQLLADSMMYWLSTYVGRVPVERLLDLAPRVFETPEDLRHVRIHAYNNLGDSKKALELLPGYLPSEDAVHRGEMDPSSWLHRHDLAALVYLQENMLDELDSVVEAALASGFSDSRQPEVMVAESLLPLADHVPVETTAQRIRFVLERGFADPNLTETTLQTATALLLGGLTKEAFNLVHFTEPFISRTDDAVESLYRFFRFATELGYGDFALARYSSPRWQMEQGISASPRCADLADGFARAQYADAQRFLETTGSTDSLERFEQRFSVPNLDPALFANSVAGLIETLGSGELHFEPLDANYDPDLLAFVNAALSEQTSFSLEALPKRAVDDPVVNKLWLQLAEDGIEMKPDVLRSIVDAAENPAIGEMTRQVIEVFAMANAGFPEVFPGRIGMRALPLALSAQPEQAGFLALRILDDFQQRDGHLDSPEAHEVFDFVGGMLRTGAFDAPLLGSLAARAMDAGRSMDAIAIVMLIEEAVAIQPGLVEDADAFLGKLGTIKGTRLGALGSPIRGAAELLVAGAAAEKRGDKTIDLANLAAAMNILLDHDRFQQAATLFDELNAKLDDPEADTGLLARVEGTEAVCRFVARLKDSLFFDLWPTTSDRFKGLLVEVADESNNGPIMAELVPVVRPVIRNLTWSQRFDESIELSAWCRNLFSRNGETHESLEVMFEHAMALGNAGRSEDAALVFESLLQRLHEFGAPDLVEKTVSYLSMFAKREDLGPIEPYAEILSRF